MCNQMESQSDTNFPTPENTNHLMMKTTWLLTGFPTHHFLLWHGSFCVLASEIDSFQIDD